MKFYHLFLLFFAIGACTETDKNLDHISNTFFNVQDQDQNEAPVKTTEPKQEIKHKFPSGKSFGLAVLQETWKGYCDGREKEYLNVARTLNYLTNDIEGLSFPDCVNRMRQVKGLLNYDLKLSAYVNTQEMFTNNSLRVWQQSNYDWIIANATQYRLFNKDNNPMSVWGGMEMMNQLSTGASVNGKTYREFINDKIIAQLDKAPGLFDSIQYDNFNHIMQYLFLGDNIPDVDVSSPWEYDAKLREGLRLMVLDMRSKRPDLKITIRSKSHKFSSVVDGVVFENALSSDIDSGIFGALNQIALIAKYSQHCVVHNTVGDDENVMTSIAVSWLFGCDASVDTLGDQDHFYTHFPVLADLYPGNPVGEIQGPKVIVYEEDVNLVSGSCVTVKGNTGDIAVAWYDIIDGTFGLSGMNGLFKSVDKDDPNFSWDSGLRVEVMKENNPELCFEGPGQLSLDDLTVYRMNEKSVFYREFDNIEIFVNPFSDRSVDAVAKDGTAVQLKAGQGIVRKIW